MLLGIDSGGTFTDFMVLDGGRLRVHKVLSTPDAPERAILQGIAELGLSSAGLQVVHGTTVATNAVLEGKGVRTVFITNRGLGDMLSIGRQARRALYDLQPALIAPPIPREQCLETGGRLAADGSVIEPLTADDLAALRAQLAVLAPQAVAINLLFSFLDDGFERAVEAVVPDGVFVSRSSYILPEYREYERGMTTVLNAWVGPLVEGYLHRLGEALAPASVSVMQSSGGTLAAAQAGRQAVHLLLSGPAGGLAGAKCVAGKAGHARLLTLDMGGTSTDVALIDGDIRLTSEGRIGSYPVAVPMVDMHTIGAGGGSLASIDAGGLLRVGPGSAGADPGPACYGRGGGRATVTDANLVLGRLRADAFLGGAMRLDVAAARAAVGELAPALGLSVEATAEGIVRIANEHMAHALRVISVQRGIDPRGFTLVSFGGAGGLHVCALADALGIRDAMVPVHAGVLSALGMLAAPRARQLSRTVNGLLEEFAEAELMGYFAALAEQGRGALEKEGVAAEAISVQRSLDLRYRGQSYTLNVAWDGGAATAAAFHASHERRYGHRLAQPVELVNLRVGLRGPIPELPLARMAATPPAVAPVRQVQLCGVAGDAPVFLREDLYAGQGIAGPALIVETVSTTYLAPGWCCAVDDYGNLILRREAEPITRPARP